MQAMGVAAREAVLRQSPDAVFDRLFGDAHPEALEK